MSVRRLTLVFICIYLSILSSNGENVVVAGMEDGMSTTNLYTPDQLVSLYETYANSVKSSSDGLQQLESLLKSDSIGPVKSVQNLLLGVYPFLFPLTILR